jgi:hypothetical protein
MTALTPANNVPPIGEFTPFELAALSDLISELGEEGVVLQAQLRVGRVVHRENTFVGFYTSVLVDPGAPRLVSRRPIVGGHYRAYPLAHGVGIILWGDEGLLTTIEGWTVEDDELTDDVLAKLQFGGKS